jgi:hypothetical protein
MMRIFLSNNVTLLFLVIITTIDASRIFYLPLPKIHSSHHELKSSPIVQESPKKLHEQKSISDEFIPLSAMERNMYEEQEESETNQNELDPWTLLDRETRRPAQTILNDDNDEINAAFNRFSQLDKNYAIEKSWAVDPGTGQMARLQSNGALDDLEQKKRRNDTLFLVIVGSCSLVGVLGLVAAAIFWYKIQKKAETTLDAEYPSYGVTGPSSSGGKISPSSTMSDRKLAQSAQMFHY